MEIITIESGKLNDYLHHVDLREFGMGRVLTCFIAEFDDCNLILDCGSSLEVKTILRYAKRNKIDLSKVKYLITTHHHFDHAGGMVPAWPAIETTNWIPHFPNATYLVGKTQYERSLSPHLRDNASYIPGLAEKLSNSGNLVLLDADQPVIENLGDWLSFHFTDGHTPGLMHALIKGEKETIFFASDIIPGTPWVNLPIVMGYDRYPEQTVNEKKMLMERAVAERWLLFYTHDPHTVASRVRLNSKEKYEAYEPLTSMEAYNI